MYYQKLGQRKTWEESRTDLLGEGKWESVLLFKEITVSRKRKAEEVLCHPISPEYLRVYIQSRI